MLPNNSREYQMMDFFADVEDASHKRKKKCRGCDGMFACSGQDRMRKHFLPTESGATCNRYPTAIAGFPMARDRVIRIATVLQLRAVKSNRGRKRHQHDAEQVQHQMLAPFSSVSPPAAFVSPAGISLAGANG